ncbi:hypothetical protein ES703_61962 [subsurface metagenome]
MIEVNLVGYYTVSQKLNKYLFFFYSIHLYLRDASNSFNPALQEAVEHVV